MSLAIARLDQLSPLTDPHLRDALKSARVIVVTATEDIDRFCENTPNLARTMLDEALMRLRRSVKTLFGLGVTAIVISADHGYLFGEKLTSGEGIDPPGGKTVALKLRVWVGQGGAKVEGTLRAPLSAFGVGGALELVTPAASLHSRCRAAPLSISTQSGQSAFRHFDVSSWRGYA